MMSGGLAWVVDTCLPWFHLSMSCQGSWLGCGGHQLPLRGRWGLGARELALCTSVGTREQPISTGRRCCCGSEGEMCRCLMSALAGNMPPILSVASFSGSQLCKWLPPTVCWPLHTTSGIRMIKN